MTISKTRLWTPVLAGLLLTAPACDDKKDEAKADDGKAAEKKPEPKDPATLIAGDKPTVPTVFKGLEPGMTVEEAKKKLPGLPEEDRIEDPEYDGMYFYAYIPKDDDEIKNLRAQLPKDKALDMVKAKWGEPVEGEDLGKPVHYWFNPETKIRASLKQSFGDDMDLEFEKYEPAAQLLGEGKDIAFLSKAPVLGASPEELEKAYGEWFYKETEEEAKKNKEAIDKFSGGKTAGITTDKPSIRLELDPPEYGGNFMWVNFYWTDDNKVRRYTFDLSYRQAPAKKDEIFDLFKKKWGEPKEEQDLGRQIFVFSEEPFIVVRPNDITKTWDVEVEAKRG
jgi:hypothetical protein